MNKMATKNLEESVDIPEIRLKVKQRSMGSHPHPVAYLMEVTPGFEPANCSFEMRPVYTDKYPEYVEVYLVNNETGEEVLYGGSPREDVASVLLDMLTKETVTNMIAILRVSPKNPERRVKVINETEEPHVITYRPK